MSTRYHQSLSLRFAVLVLVASWLLNSCAGEMPQEPIGDTSQEKSQHLQDQRPNERNRGTLTAFDKSIPLTTSETYWYLKDDLQSLSDTSALGFVSRVTGYVERIRTIPHSDDTPDEDRGYDVYDGIVFSVDDVLTGQLDPGVSAVTVAVRTLTLNPDSTPRFRISESPMETIRLGIEQRDRQDGPSYLVYVTEDTETYSPFYDSGYYLFNTPGGVAPMLDGKRIGNAADRPLARPVVVEDGVYGQTDHGLTLDDARAVGRVAEDENGRSSDGSAPDPLSDLVPGDIGSVGATDE